MTSIFMNLIAGAEAWAERMGCACSNKMCRLGWRCRISTTQSYMVAAPNHNARSRVIVYHNFKTLLFSGHELDTVRGSTLSLPRIYLHQYHEFGLQTPLSMSKSITLWE